MSDTDATSTDQRTEQFPDQRPEQVVILEAPLVEAKRLRASLAAKGIAAEVVKPPPGACCGGGCSARFWVAVGADDVAAVRVMLAPKNDSPVVDFNAPMMTCPACLTPFATGPLACPDCGLALG